MYRRYERAEPGQLLHLDVKGLGRIVRVGHRITGNPRDRVYGAGWEYVHVAIADTSRVAYAQVLPDETGDSAVLFLRAAVAYSAGLGITIREVLTDNGGGYLSKPFAAARRDLGLIHRRTRLYTPRTNGKAERFIQTALHEWAHARAYQRSVHAISALPHWLHGHNWRWPHASLAGRPPASRLGCNFLRLHNPVAFAIYRHPAKQDPKSPANLSDSSGSIATCPCEATASDGKVDGTNSERPWKGRSNRRTIDGTVGKEASQFPDQRASNP